MREVDFRHLQSALLSLSSSTDLVLVRGQVRATLSRRCSPYSSHRQVRFDLVSQPLGADVLLVVNYRKVLLVGFFKEEVAQAAEAVGQAGRPFEGSQLGWDGPWAAWVSEPVPSGLPLLRVLIRSAHEYGLIGSEWLESPLLYAAWLVPVVMEWGDDGQPVFSWPDLPGEPEPVDQDLP